MVNKIKINSHFHVDIFASFFSSSSVFLGMALKPICLRPIDSKILNFLISLEKSSMLDVFDDIFGIFEFFRLDCKMEDSVTYEIIKLSFKKKNYNSHIQNLSEDKKKKVIFLIDNLNLKLFKFRSKPSIICAFFEFFYAVRSNRLGLVKYKKYKNLFSEIKLENYFGILRIIFKNEIEGYCQNSYSIFKDNFLSNGNSNGNSYSNNSGNAMILKTNIYKTNYFLLNITESYIRELTNVGDILKKQHEFFIDFVNKKVKVFYLGPYFFSLSLLIYCLSNLQKILFSIITKDLCKFYFRNLAIDEKNRNRASVVFYLSLGVVIDSFYIHFTGDPSRCALSSISSSLKNYLNSILSNLTLKDFDKENLELKPINFVNFSKQMKKRRNKKLQKELMIHMKGLEGSFDLLSDINLSLLKNKLKNYPDFLCIILFFEKVTEILRDIFINFKKNYIDYCNLI